MAYYDEGFYALNATIASHNSMLVDLRHNYNRLLSKILTLGPENVPIDLVQEQLGLVNSIKEKKQTIAMLEAELTTFTPMQPPEVILQQILEQQQQQQVQPVEQVVQPVQQVPEEVVQPVEQVSEEILQPVQQVPEEVVQPVEQVSEEVSTTTD